MDELFKTIETVNIFVDKIENLHYKEKLTNEHRTYTDNWGEFATGNSRGSFLFDVAIHNERHSQLNGYYLALGA